MIACSLAVVETNNSCCKFVSKRRWFIAKLRGIFLLLLTSTTIPLLSVLSLYTIIAFSLAVVETKNSCCKLVSRRHWFIAKPRGIFLLLLTASPWSVSPLQLTSWQLGRSPEHHQHLNSQEPSWYRSCNLWGSFPARFCFIHLAGGSVSPPQVCGFGEDLEIALASKEPRHH